MKNEIKFKISLIASMIIILISLIMYLGNNTLWHYPAVVGVWLLFDFFAFKVNGNSSLNLIFNKEIKIFLLWFVILFILGGIIEIVGRIMFNLWYYTDPLDTGLIGYLFYPFILMSFKEIYYSLKKFSKNPIILTLSSMILGIIIWEIPNVYSKDWIYTIPYITWEIMGINIVVILGWFILIGFPVYIYKKLGVKK